MFVNDTRRINNRTIGWSPNRLTVRNLAYVFVCVCVCVMCYGKRRRNDAAFKHRLNGRDSGAGGSTSLLPLRACAQHTFALSSGKRRPHTTTHVVDDDDDDDAVKYSDIHSQNFTTHTEVIFAPPQHRNIYLQAANIRQEVKHSHRHRVQITSSMRFRVGARARARAFVAHI